MSNKHPYYLSQARKALEQALAAGSGLLAPPVLEEAAAYLVTGAVLKHGLPYSTPPESLNEHVCRLLTWLRHASMRDAHQPHAIKVAKMVTHDLNEYLLKHHA